MRVLNTQQMREADRRTIDEIGIPAIVLMENAGRQAVAAMEAAFEDLATSHVAVLCGRGNNGGDGFVVARTLIQRGVDVSVFLLGSVSDVRGDARTNLESAGADRAHGRRDHGRAGVGAALHRDLGVRPDRRRDPRARASTASSSGLLEHRRRRRQRDRRPGRGHQSADRRVGRFPRGRWGRPSRRR